MITYSITASGITREDICQAVIIHRQVIANGFLSTLGGGALELIFSLAADSKTGVLLIAKEKATKRVCGFLLGTSNTGAFYKEFLLRKSLVAVISLWAKLLSFGRIKNVVETLLYPSRSSIQVFPKAELLDIAVSQPHQGTGLAQSLFWEFSNLLQVKMIDEFKITTGESLIGARRFYERLGAEQVSMIEVHKGKKTIVYVYSLDSKIFSKR